MKKLIALLLAVMMVLSLVACAAKDNTAADTSKDAETEEKTDDTAKEETPAEETPAEETPADDTASTAAGSVYYLNFKPEADEAWQKLAADYTAETGVPVKVVTAASGDYDKTLSAQMGKDGAPTLFNVGNSAAVANWDDYCLDLTDSKLAGELTTQDFNLYNDAGELKSVGYCYESFGIIVNKALLEKAGHSLDEIKDFASLKSVVEDIHANADTLGFDAFTASGLDSSSSWRFSGHLANMPLF